MNQPSTSTDIPNPSNHSIDRVVFQIERMGGQINDLVLNSKQHVDDMLGHGSETIDEFNKHFAVGKEGVDTLLGMLDSKFGGFPINALYVLLAISLVVLIVFLLYLMTTGSEKISNRYDRIRTRRRQRQIALHEAP